MTANSNKAGPTDQTRMQQIKLTQTQQQDQR